MKTATEMLHVRVEGDVKDDAALILKGFGLSMADAVRILLRQVVNTGSFPIELKQPNATTLAAMKEVEAMIQANQQGKYANADELFDALEKD